MKTNALSCYCKDTDASNNMQQGREKLRVDDNISSTTVQVIKKTNNIHCIDIW